MNSINSDPEQDPLTYKDVLEQSTTDLSPSIKAHLNASRRAAMSSFEYSSSTHIWKPAMALLIPVIAVTMIMLNTAHQEIPDSDLYSDIELLIDEEQLDFLADLDISEWQTIGS